MKNIFFQIFLFLPLLSHAQSVVTKSAGAGNNLPSEACKACPGSVWNDAMSITSADGLVTMTGLNEAGNCFMSTCFYSRYLYAHDFNFAIPADATIDSIFVDIRRSALMENAIVDSIVQLEKNDSIVGANLRSAMLWPTALAYKSYGHNNPLWGTTWLPADINNPASGVVLKIMNLSSSVAEAAVDHIRMTVYYTTTTGIFSVTSSPADIALINSPGEIQVNIFTPRSLNATMKIYNSGGQEVIFNNYGNTLAGPNTFRCNTKDLDAGIYFLVMNIGRQFFSGKFVVID